MVVDAQEAVAGLAVHTGLLHAVHGIQVLALLAFYIHAFRAIKLGAVAVQGVAGHHGDVLAG